MLRYRLLNIFVSLTVCVFKITAQSGNRGDNRNDLLRFFSLISGLYAGQQIQDDGHLIQDDGHLITIQKIVLPVEVSAFYPALTYFMEEKIGEEPPLREVHILHKSPAGLIVSRCYGFIGSENMSITDNVVDVSIFKTKPHSDYYKKSNCDITTTQVGNSYMSDWPDGDHIFNNLVPIYVTVWSCNEVGYIRYNNPYQITDRIILQVDTKLKRYPLLSYMLKDAENFTDPCI